MVPFFLYCKNHSQNAFHADKHCLLGILPSHPTSASRMGASRRLSPSNQDVCCDGATFLKIHTYVECHVCFLSISKHITTRY